MQNRCMSPPSQEFAKLRLSQHIHCQDEVSISVVTNVCTERQKGFSLRISLSDRANNQNKTKSKIEDAANSYRYKELS